MRVLVTGRDGQIARALNELAEGHPDIELRFAARPQVDLSVPGSVAAAIEEARPDIVINAAAFTDVDRAEVEPALAMRVNADAAGEAAGAAAAIDASIIQLSTDYVFDGAKSGPYSEGDPVNPLNVYGASKLSGEGQVRSINPRHLILRTSWVISPFGRNFAKSILAAVRTRDTLTVVDDQRGRPTSALDFAEALLGVVQRWSEGDEVGLGSTYHLAGGGGEASWFDLARAIIDEGRPLGLNTPKVKPIKSAEWPTRARRPHNSVLDCSRFERDFGFGLSDWQSSLGPIVRGLNAETSG